jgi:hypothetical protein
MIGALPMVDEELGGVWISTYDMDVYVYYLSGVDLHIC